MSKVYQDTRSAISDIQDGSSLLVGGFGLCGIPENCISALKQKGVKDLTCISNNAGVDDFGLGLLLQTHQIKKMIASYVGENKEFETAVFGLESWRWNLSLRGHWLNGIRSAGVGVPAF